MWVLGMAPGPRRPATSDLERDLVTRFSHARAQPVPPAATVLTARRPRSLAASPARSSSPVAAFGRLGLVGSPAGSPASRLLALALPLFLLPPLSLSGSVSPSYMLKPSYA